jgi:5-methyltetrahydrofolate--homocysteine methyltransferase
MAGLTEISEKLISGDITGVGELVQAAIDAGETPSVILNEGLVRGMDIVGEKMNRSELFIPEVLRCARAMNAGIKLLKPLLGEGDLHSAGKIVIGTVQGDLHDIGKNLVTMMLESAGFEVVNMGVDISPEVFVQTALAESADIVAISALLTTTVPMIKKTIDAFVETGLRNKLKIIVGGAPLTPEFADQIGADGYAADAGSAAKLAKSLI